MTIEPTKAYLDRTGRRIGILAKSRMPESSRWRWLTTRGYYVQADGRAAHRGESRHDLVQQL